MFANKMQTGFATSFLPLNPASATPHLKIIPIFSLDLGGCVFASGMLWPLQNSCRLCKESVLPEPTAPKDLLPCGSIIPLLSLSC